MVFHYPDTVSIPSYRPTYRGNAKQVKQAAQLISEATRPLIMAGGGVVAAHACPELVELAERMQIPVVTTLMGKAAIPCSNPLNLGPLACTAPSTPTWPSPSPTSSSPAARASRTA